MVERRDLKQPDVQVAERWIAYAKRREPIKDAHDHVHRMFPRA